MVQAGLAGNERPSHWGLALPSPGSAGRAGPQKRRRGAHHPPRVTRASGMRQMAAEGPPARVPQRVPPRSGSAPDADGCHLAAAGSCLQQAAAAERAPECHSGRGQTRQREVKKADLADTSGLPAVTAGTSEAEGERAETQVQTHRASGSSELPRPVSRPRPHRIHLRPQEG